MSGYVYGIPRTAAVRPRPRRWPQLVGVVAAAAGHVLRLGRAAAVHAPGVGGAGAITFGAWLAWAPAGFLVAGGFLLLLDRRMS